MSEVVPTVTPEQGCEVHHQTVKELLLHVQQGVHIHCVALSIFNYGRGLAEGQKGA